MALSKASGYIKSIPYNGAKHEFVSMAAYAIMMVRILAYYK